MKLSVIKCFTKLQYNIVQVDAVNKIGVALWVLYHAPTASGDGLISIRDLFKALRAVKCVAGSAQWPCFVRVVMVIKNGYEKPTLPDS